MPNDFFRRAEGTTGDELAHVNLSVTRLRAVRIVPETLGKAINHYTRLLLDALDGPFADPEAAH